MDRWKAVHQVDNSIPYPETEIDEQDWTALNTLMFGEIDDENGGYGAEMTCDFGNEIYEFIIGGEESDHPIVKQAMEMNNY